VIDDRRHARNEALREWIDRGASCPFCGSLRLDVDLTSEVPKPELMRINCDTCGYIAFFEPSKFGQPRRS
jgi:DNA-directed RNA polymerase subunit RPC12/RpoP